MMFEHDIYYTTIFLQCGVWIVLPLCLLWCKNKLDIVLNFIWGNSSCDVNPQKAAFMELQVQSYLGGSNVCVVWGMVVSEFLDRFCGGYGRSVIWDQSKRVMFSWTPSSVSVFFLEPDSVLGPVDGEVIRGRFLSLQISLKISALH